MYQPGRLKKSPLAAVVGDGASTPGRAVRLSAPRGGLHHGHIRRGDRAGCARRRRLSPRHPTGNELADAVLKPAGRALVRQCCLVRASAVRDASGHVVGNQTQCPRGPCEDFQILRDALGRDDADQESAQDKDHAVAGAHTSRRLRPAAQIDIARLGHDGRPGSGNIVRCGDITARRHRNNALQGGDVKRIPLASAGSARPAPSTRFCRWKLQRGARL